MHLPEESTLFFYQLSQITSHFSLPQNSLALALDTAASSNHPSPTSAMSHVGPLHESHSPYCSQGQRTRASLPVALIAHSLQNQLLYIKPPPLSQEGRADGWIYSFQLNGRRVKKLLLSRAVQHIYINVHTYMHLLWERNSKGQSVNQVHTKVTHRHTLLSRF